MDEKRRYHVDSDTIFETIVRISTRSRLTVKEIDSSVGRVILASPPSAFSYGEIIEIIVRPTGSHESLVFIRSNPKFFINITAGGAIERNIKRMFSEIDLELGIE